MSLRIALRDAETGEVVTHALASHGNYSTMCGCSDDDVQFVPVDGEPGRIDCTHCRAIFDQCKSLRSRDFSAPRFEP